MSLTPDFEMRATAVAAMKMSMLTKKNTEQQAKQKILAHLKKNAHACVHKKGRMSLFIAHPD